MTAYPRARWRLVSGPALGRVMVWASHILIRHADSDRRATASLLDWYIDEPPRRSRAEALALALQVAGEVHLQPDQFGALARLRSEDPSSAAFGGSLGGVRASDLMDAPAILDALAALKVGEISRVVETSHGFHIVQRHAPALQARVSAIHLVLGHGDAPTLAAMTGFPSTRSRAEALAMANELHRSASLEPSAFSALVRQYSEHPDRGSGGDFGSWSLREPSQQALALQALQHLPMGGLTPPIDTPYGIEIFQRTAERPRRNYAVEALELAFGPGDPLSKREVLALARQLVVRAQEDPASFDQLRRTYCCPGTRRWDEGREELGMTDLTRAVQALAFNEISAEPVELYGAMVVLRRRHPESSVPEPAVSLDLPAPERVDLDSMLRGMVSPDLIARGLLELAQTQPTPVARQKAPLLQELEELLTIEEPDDAARARLMQAIQEFFETDGSLALRPRLEELITERVFHFGPPGAG